ncbi:hypothetical protein [Cellulosimicrobium funkei]
MIMPSLLRDVEAAGMTLADVKDAMRSIGYNEQSVHMLDRWESKRTTGNSGRYPHALQVSAAMAGTVGVRHSRTNSVIKCPTRPDRCPET